MSSSCKFCSDWSTSCWERLFCVSASVVAVAAASFCDCDAAAAFLFATAAFFLGEHAALVRASPAQPTERLLNWLVGIVQWGLHEG